MRQALRMLVRRTLAPIDAPEPDPSGVSAWRARPKERRMPAVDLEQLQELLTRARAICELARLATHHEVAEALRPNTLESSLRMVEDLLGHALAHLPALRALEARSLEGNAHPERNSG